MMTDPIADMLTRIRNAQNVRKPDVSLPFSNVKMAIARILEVEGYLTSVHKTPEGELSFGLKYREREPVIRSIDRISTPGRRVYKPANDLPRVLNDRGIAVISTSQGIMTNKEARKRKLGGEVMCEVY